MERVDNNRKGRGLSFCIAWIDAVRSIQVDFLTSHFKRHRLNKEYQVFGHSIGKEGAFFGAKGSLGGRYPDTHSLWRKFYGWDWLELYVEHHGEDKRAGCTKSKLLSTIISHSRVNVTLTVYGPCNILSAFLNRLIRHSLGLYVRRYIASAGY